LAGAWVGDDEAKAVNVAGSRNALPIWATFMVKAYDGLAAEAFPRPDDVVSARIDPLSGGLARSGCPVTVEEVFVRGSEPTLECPLHAGGIKGWFFHLFQKK
jgi:penicillin-binding protein 1A